MGRDEKGRRGCEISSKLFIGGRRGEERGEKERFSM
jgi:hypothetical protein